MVCKECPYVLACWSGVYEHLHCKLCGRRILNTNPGFGMTVVADVIIVHDCSSANPQEFNLQSSCCSVCASEAANSAWVDTHDWIHEEHGLHLVLKKSSGA